MPQSQHIDFIAAAYAAGILVIAALITWVALDYRAQRRKLAELETQGVTRRSAAARAAIAKEDA
ncbi:MAG TPA: heme exporter protein CcmD [Xanthobacteraceae bacterium]|nr:heme exporter protein CcmD [Xanthobacteraceae bacterium]